MAPRRFRSRPQPSRTKRYLASVILNTALVTVFVLWLHCPNAIESTTSRPSQREQHIEPTTLRSAHVVDELETLLLASRKLHSHMDNSSSSDNVTDDPPTRAATASRGLYQGNTDPSELHIVFSMSCDQGRRVSLQTVLQYSAVSVGQRGPITQILSGCSDAQRQRVSREPTLYYDFRRHFTPSYSPHPLPHVSDDYAPYNKPFALRHFLQNAQPPVTHDIIALIDGDMIFFKPLEVNTGRDVTTYYHGTRPVSTVNDTVVDGIAIAQDWYNYVNDGWYAPEAREKLAAVCTGQPCMNVSREDAREYYSSTGPPYIMTHHDMTIMVDDYCSFVVRGRQADDGWMVEMVAYALAVANHGIKHTLLTNLGVTHPRLALNQREYWSFVDETLANPCDDTIAVVVPRDPPVGIHYCQIYGFVEGDHKGHYYYKYDLPETLMNCDSPLLMMPPASDWDTLEQTTTHELLLQKRHEVWMACSTSKIVNQAVIKYKQRTCPDGFNTEKSIEMVKP
ncbi:unnamed protein product [Hyaloperonospora brassicae]|uniref:Uncharacterized protein n=1 Tax=Hyaloperonospora brassicae TaxID=162125 RepID=A0AAV0U0K1_HYABA|nr:unnamed protein product [Hyaloperonospora brassicae]